MTKNGQFVWSIIELIAIQKNLIFYNHSLLLVSDEVRNGLSCSIHFKENENSNYKKIYLKLVNNNSEIYNIENIKIKCEKSSELKSITPEILYYGKVEGTEDINFIITEYLKINEGWKCFIDFLMDIDKKNVILTHENIKKICNNLCHGLSILHSNGIVHHDLKTDNIFINVLESNEFKINFIDFGFSCQDQNNFCYNNNGKTHKFPQGSPYYMVCDKDVYKYDNTENKKKLDIWSMKIILIELLSVHLGIEYENYYCYNNTIIKSKEKRIITEIQSLEYSKNNYMNELYDSFKKNDDYYFIDITKTDYNQLKIIFAKEGSS